MTDIHNNAEGRSAARGKKSVDRHTLQKKPKDGVQLNPYNPDTYWFE